MTGTAADRQRSPVRLDEAFGNGQAKPGAAIGARRRRLGLPERL